MLKIISEKILEFKISRINSLIDSGNFTIAIDRINKNDLSLNKINFKKLSEGVINDENPRNFKLILRLRKYDKLTEENEKFLINMVKTAPEELILDVIRYYVMSLSEFYKYITINFKGNLVKAHGGRGWSINFSINDKLSIEKIEKIKRDILEVGNIIDFWNTISTIDDKEYLLHISKILFSDEDFCKMFDMASKKNSIFYSDTLIFYTKRNLTKINDVIRNFIKSKELVGIIDLVDSFDCDNIDTYDLILEIGACGTTDALIKALEKSNLSKEEQRAILLQNKKTCKIR